MRIKDIWAVLLNRRAQVGSREVLAHLDIKPCDIIADIGCGGGYFALELAKRTGAGGKVFAVDIDEGFLAYVEKRAEKLGIHNVETAVGAKDGCPLPKESCDLVFMRNVFHHIDKPVSYFAKLRESIKPGGRIAVIDWKKTKSGHIGRAGHYASEEEIRRVMRETGFAHSSSLDFLSKQSFNIFQKPFKREF